jgi:hypothetical protein
MNRTKYTKREVLPDTKQLGIYYILKALPGSAGRMSKTVRIQSLRPEIVCLLVSDLFGNH